MTTTNMILKPLPEHARTMPVQLRRGDGTLHILPERSFLADMVHLVVSAEDIEHALRLKPGQALVVEAGVERHAMPEEK